MATKKTVVKKTTVKKTTTKTVARKRTTKPKVVQEKQVQLKKQEPLKKQQQEKQVQEVQKPRRLKKKYIVFLCLYALSFILYYSSTSLARYASQVTKTGSVGVAKWDVTLNGESSETLETITIGDDDTYQEFNLTVTSASEVGITYSAVLTNVPEGLYIIVDDDEYNPYNPQNGTITINNLGSFDASENGQSRTHKLKFIVPIGSDAFSNREIDIDVVFSQVQI